MTTLASTETPHRQGSWLSRSEAWLDARGKGAWIAAMVLGFIFFWPIGLGLLSLTQSIINPNKLFQIHSHEPCHLPIPVIG